MTIARRDKDRTHWKKFNSVKHSESEEYHEGKKSTDFCSNSSIAEAYLTRIRSLITELQGNPAYHDILTIQWANLIKYVEDPTNEGLIQSNCAGFIQGLQAAKKADGALIMEQKKLSKIIAKQFRELDN